MAKVNRDQGDDCVRMQELLDEARQRIEELEEENEQQRQEAASNEYYVQRGLEYDEFPEIEGARTEIERLKEELMNEQRAARDARADSLSFAWEQCVAARLLEIISDPSFPGEVHQSFMPPRLEAIKATQDALKHLAMTFHFDLKREAVTVTAAADTQALARNEQLEKKNKVLIARILELEGTDEMARSLEYERMKNADLKEKVQWYERTESPLPALHARPQTAFDWVNCPSKSFGLPKPDLLDAQDRKAWEKGRAGLWTLLQMAKAAQW